MNSINVTIIAIILLAISTIAGSSLVFFIKKNLTDKASNIIILSICRFLQNVL